MNYNTAIDGHKVSLLGYGAMRLPTVDGGHANTWAADVSSGEIDQKLLNAQIRKLLDAGVNYFDTSPAYCRGESEKRLGVALAHGGHKRRDYFIATKLSNFAPEQYPLEKCKEMLAKSLENLGVDYIDMYLLHNVGAGGMETFRKRYVDNGAIDWLVEERKRGTIRHLGFSFHGDPKVFDWCLEHHAEYHWDFAQIQMNYLDWKHAKRQNERNLDAEYLYRRLAELDIPVVVMEPLLGGTLAKYNHAISRELVPLDPEASQARWAFRFCASFPKVMTVLSGMTFTDHIEENVRIFQTIKPLRKFEFEALERAAKAYLACDAVPCTSCSYCMPCPYGIDIPKLFLFRNECLVKDAKASPKRILEQYSAYVPNPLRRADHCTGCGRCRCHCPQQIDIPTEIADIDRAIDVLKAEEMR